MDICRKGWNMKSIIQTEKECYVCNTTQNLHLHHCIAGTANRRQSDKYGLTVWLCAYHHNMSDEGVHFNKPLDIHLKKIAQEKFEVVHGSRNEFIKSFGKSYL